MRNEVRQVNVQAFRKDVSNQLALFIQFESQGCEEVQLVELELQLMAFDNRTEKST
jgi:hypothetical protein